MTTKWHTAAATTNKWNTSWYPNTIGLGSGRWRPYTTAPTV